MEPKFSQRMGFTDPPKIQMDSVTEPLRNSIWNLFLFITEELCDFSERDEMCYEAVRTVARGFLRVRTDTVTYGIGASHWLAEYYFKLPWYDVYNFLEFLVENSEEITDGRLKPDMLVPKANYILEKEMSGYRFINGTLSPISGEAEIAAIEGAISKSTSFGLGGVQTHLKEALRLLGLKPEPDYRNSIKEAISAVESATKLIGGTTGGGLDAPLKELSKKTPIHPALLDGFINLYGFTSNEDGIRHAILDQPNVGYDEAKFMLVACSAFVNFLISKAEKASILKIQ